MVIQIDPKKVERLQAIAKATGRTVEQVVDTAIDRVINEVSPADSEGKISPKRKAEMLKHLEEIRKLAAEEIPDDGFSIDDIDKVVYRIDG
jgi:hypothetical protein